MEMVKHICSICNDTKHFFKNGGWIRCTCLEKDVEQKKYNIAGISINPKELTFENINSRYSYAPIGKHCLGMFKNIDGFFKKSEKPDRRVCVQGAAIGAKDVAIQTILKTAVQAGLKVKQYSMEELIRIYFKEEDYNGLEEEFKKYDIFSVYFGSEIQNHVGGTFLQELIRYTYKHNTYLFLHTSLTLDVLKIRYDQQSLGDLFVRHGSKTGANDKRVIFISLEQ